MAPRTRGWRRIADDLALARRLRRERFDLVLDLHGGPRSAWLTWATGATDADRLRHQGPALDVHAGRAIGRASLRPRHSVVNQWDLLEAIPGWPGGSADPTRDRGGDGARPGRRRADGGAAGARPAWRHGDELIVLHVSAGNPFRRWPEPVFAETAAALASGSPRRRLVFSSGPSDRDAAARIAADARGTARSRRATAIVDLGEFDLQELRALIGRSRLFVGGDTGPLHIAATTATPVVGIYGPTLAARSAPWRPRRDPDAVDRDAVEDLPCRPCDQRVCAPGDFRA